MSSDEKNIFEEILMQKYPERTYFEASDSGHQMLIDRIHDGYTFTGFVSNLKLENKGFVKHYLVATNNFGQYKFIERDFSRGFKDASWNIIDGYNKVTGPIEEKFDSLYETLLTLKDQKYYPSGIESYFDDTLIENNDLIVGLVGIQQTPPIQIIPIIHPFKENEVVWIETLKRID
ncbi:hypothetical protein JXA48_03280 [Candidatus Woesearchaeota archaeon]|nr:hypothetical protein [Candidatus Woesearchaeota archaeon]